MNYLDFIKSKESASQSIPVTSDPVFSDCLFDFQKECVNRAVENGKYALFCDTGLGKTLMQLSWAENVLRSHGPVLILAPLAVKEQTIREAAKFGVGVDADVMNYDQLHNIDISKYSGVVLDESSILKNFNGKMRGAIIDGFRDTPFKLACSATPAPNDHTELGNHSEFLNVLPRVEMLSEYFVHDAAKTQDWRLKGHAVSDFWRWVRSWSTIMRNPADLGFDGSKYILPKLDEHILWVDEPVGSSAASFREAAALRRNTINERADKIASMIDDNEPALIWCDYNDEAKAIADRVPGSVNVHGAMTSQKKAENMLGFSDGDVRVLITKPKIAGFGMNWQHCNRVFFAGPSHSFESRYQSIRRCWRFGQKKEVKAYTCATVSEQLILSNVMRKAQKHTMMGMYND